MIRAFTRHKVEDYDVWRAVYDGFADDRRSMGVVNDRVFRDVADGNDVTVYLDFETLEAAQSFVNSDWGSAAMDKAGDAPEREIWIVEEA